MVMDARAIEERCFSINKSLGQLVGIWPDQRYSMKLFLRLFTFTVIMSANVTQIARVARSFSLAILTDQMPFLILGLGTLLKQHNYVLNETRLKELLRGVIADWLTDRPKEELMILETYSKKAILFQSVYKVAIGCTLVMFAIVPVVPTVLDVILPLNQSREHIFIYPAYYFVDGQKYYYLIVLHMYFASCIVAFVFIAADVNLVYTVQHACSLFAISGHRFKNAMRQVSEWEDRNAQVQKNSSYYNLCKSIEAHKEALRYVEKVEGCHLITAFLSVGLSVMILAVTLIKITMIELSVMHITLCMFVVGQLVHIFFLNIMGQFVVDSNDTILSNIYEGLWYECPVQNRFLYAMALHRCSFQPKLTGAGVINLNLVTFLQIVKASFSYYGFFKTV